ncbi:MAG: hypothetical protein WD016_09690 [Balneolaceae bacterium]
MDSHCEELLNLMGEEIHRRSKLLDKLFKRIQGDCPVGELGYLELHSGLLAMTVVEYLQIL